MHLENATVGGVDIYLFLVPGMRGEYNILHQAPSCQHISICAAVYLGLEAKLYSH